MTAKVRVLTGITTTGTPHLGNYVGAIRPAIAASRTANVESFYFLADYHALIKCQEPERIQRSTLEIAATWLACGLEPEKVFFYRQSDIPEIPELTWLLTCVASKGLLNRAHAYKASVDQNNAAGEDADAGISMGLFCYPILMAADILMFNANRVPVGRDQVQHIEMARDIGQRFNHLFGQGDEYFVLPEAAIEESVATLPGLDGRKMSKSYDNTIPLFAGGAKALRESIMKIVTDSKLPGEPKDPDNSHLFTLFRAFASAQETAAFRAALVQGLAWGEAKQRLFDLIEREIAPLRASYDALIANPEELEARLNAGAAKARALAAPLLSRLREAVGLRRLTVAVGPILTGGVRDTQSPSAFEWKFFREADGSFRFKVKMKERTILTSEKISDPKVAKTEFLSEIAHSVVSSDTDTGTGSFVVVLATTGGRVLCRSEPFVGVDSSKAKADFLAEIASLARD